jgi:hypothetical protein
LGAGSKPVNYGRLIERNPIKTAGIVIAVIGGLNTAVTQYDLSSSHDVSKAFGGIRVSIGTLVVGFLLYTKGKKKADQEKH